MAKRKNQEIDVETVAILRLGTEEERVRLAADWDKTLPDAVRLLLVKDKSSLVRYWAALTSREDSTRLAFKNDVDWKVRSAAVTRARDDATRLAFREDKESMVRYEALSGAKSDETRLAFKDDSTVFVRYRVASLVKTDKARLEFLSDPNYEVRKCVVERMESTDIVKRVVWQDADERVRKAAADRLVAIMSAQKPRRPRHL